MFPIPLPPSTIPWYSHARLGCVFVTDGTASAEYTQFPVPVPRGVKRSISCRVWVHMVLNTQCIVSNGRPFIVMAGWIVYLLQVGVATLPPPWEWLVDVCRDADDSMDIVSGS